MKKIYLQPETEIVATMIKDSCLIQTSGVNLGNGGNTSDEGVTTGDVKEFLWEENLEEDEE